MLWRRNAGPVAGRLKMTEECSLDALPTELLLHIFDCCNVYDLIRLSLVCKRFYSIIGDDTLWIRESRRPIVTNQCSKRFRDRCNPLLSLRKKWQVSHNWQCGKYDRVIIHTDRVNSIPWIRLTENVLWWSGGNRLHGYHRGRIKTNRRFQDSRKSCLFAWDNILSDICKFVVRDEYVVSGHRDGRIWFWLKNEGQEGHFDFGIVEAHASSVNAIDEIPEAVISGAADGTVKIWPQTSEIYDIRPISTLNVCDRIWSLGVDPGRTTFAVGSSGTSTGPPLRLFDIECCRERSQVSHSWRHGAGILDLAWESSHSLLSCGYDTYIRKWDLRTGTCVASWADPTDATIYCIASDFKHTMITGTQYNGKAVLWDQRLPHYVQLYFMNSRRTSSPVYSISFDSTHLVGATDRQLVEFTFSGANNRSRDYREILK
ncbi:F-box/WD repeat-containing protein 4-like [Diachasma alloeum]|uniref:F-box/WD repeat-containing protein 4-like n=1 Tax=Diachasma alloeum TaxID=454923 RepID=UPI0007383368|nr:F-box/WD repeat-containing protein 4-like [Diachasma alloeum]